VLKRSTWPTWSLRPACGERVELGGLAARARHRLLDEHVDVALEEEFRERIVRAGARRDRDRVDEPGEVSVIGEVARRDAFGHRTARRGIEVAHADELHVFERAVLLRVKPAEITDTDDRRAELLHGRATPRSELFTNPTKCSI